jgi:hypothetical protein
MERPKLPSLYQLGDFVQLQFPGNGLLKKAEIVKVSFTRHSEPVYDVAVPYEFYSGELDPDGPEMASVQTGYARIHGLAEWHLRNPEMPVADRYPLPINK